MASNRKSQNAAIRFAPALKAALLCLLIAGSAVGYVWQKSQIYLLGQQITRDEDKLRQMRSQNQRLGDQLAILRSPVMLDQRARELNLGLIPAQPRQVTRLPEPAAPTPSANESAMRQLAAREADALTP
jgi:hypothetical protein